MAGIADFSLKLSNFISELIEKRVQDNELFLNAQHNHNALHYLIETNEPKHVKDFLDNLTNQDAVKLQTGIISPIALAAQVGNPEIVELLLKKGFNVDGYEHEAPLLTTIYLNHTTVAKLLVDNQANLFKLEKKFGSALSNAQEFGNQELEQHIKNVLNKNQHVVDISYSMQQSMFGANLEDRLPPIDETDSTKSLRV